MDRLTELETEKPKMGILPAVLLIVLLCVGAVRAQETIEVEIPYKKAVVSEVCLNGFAYAVVVYAALKSGGAGITQILEKSKRLTDRLVPKTCEDK